LKDLSRYLVKCIPNASLCANIIDVPYSFIKRRNAEENVKSYYTSRVILSFLRSLIELPFLNPDIVRFNNPTYFPYFTTGETVIEAILEQSCKPIKHRKTEPKFENSNPESQSKRVKFCYVDKNDNEIPEEIRFPEITMIMYNGIKITFYDTENPEKVSELEKEIRLLERKTKGLAYYPSRNKKRISFARSLGIVEAVDKISTPPVTKAELEFFRLEYELEKPEDYSVHNPSRYCGLKIKPKESMRLEEIFTKETECQHEKEYCEKCEISKNLKDKIQKQNSV
jgi:hypothetical protein